jgi:hypothetical protein
MEDGNLRYPEWQIPLEEVITEPDVKKLPSRIHAVETLILTRLQQLEAGRDGIAEREAINTAMNVLRVVKRERLAFPDWK